MQLLEQNEPRFNGVYSRSNLCKLKNGACVINLDGYKSIRTHWIALHVIDDNVIYFHSFGVEQIPKEIKKFIDDRNIAANMFRVQAYNSVMCGYFYLGFFDFMLKSKTLLEYINLFSPNDHEKNDKIILKFFQ